MSKVLKYLENNITKALKDAANKHKHILMTLSSQPNNPFSYHFNPLKIINFDGFWHLLGINHYKEIRKLSLNKILDVVTTDEVFKINKNIRKMLEQSPNIWFDEKKNIKVIVKVDAKITPYFKSKEIFTLQKIAKEWKDGSLTI